jgi:hypothetical protein
VSREIEVPVERPGLPGGVIERGGDVAWVGAQQAVLGLAHHATLAAPTLERPPTEVAEHPGRLAGRLILGLRLGEVVGEFLFEAMVAGQPEDGMIFTRGQAWRICVTMRAASATEPAAASILERRRRASRGCR